MPHSRRRFLRRLVTGSLLLAGTDPLQLVRAAEPSPERPLGVVLVGLGRYSTGQLGPALRETQHCRLVGVVSGVPAKAAQWAQDYGFPPGSIYNYDTMHRMADNPHIDIVYVVTPNGLHAEHAIVAAEAGKHVIVEKPMANTVAECDAILAACRTHRVMHSVGYRLHFDPYHREMMRLAGADELGPFLRLSGSRSFELAAGRWRADKRLAGGGPMMDLGVYLIQASCMVSGEEPPVSVTAHELPKTKPAQFGAGVEETIEWTMRFAGGAEFAGRTSYLAPGSDTFRAEGERGWLDFKAKAFTYRGAVCETSRGPLTFEPFVNQQALQMDDFAQCVREGRPSRISGEMGRRDLRIIEAIYRAAASGRREQVLIS